MKGGSFGLSGSSGQPSAFGSLVAYGGGGGLTGGSSAPYTVGMFAGGTSGNGNSGSQGIDSGSNTVVGGGGGGAGASVNSDSLGGAGATPTGSFVDVDSVGGGGGGGFIAGGPIPTGAKTTGAGAGGIGGGGDGGDATSGSNGLAGTGGGGGGAGGAAVVMGAVSALNGYTGGTGGTGVVIVRFAAAPAPEPAPTPASEPQTTPRPIPAPPTTPDASLILTTRGGTPVMIAGRPGAALIRVTNTAPVALTNAVLTVRAPAGVSLTGVTPLRAKTGAAAKRSATVRIGTLAAGATLTYRVRLRANRSWAGKSFALRATLAATDVSPKTDSVRIRVRAVPAPPAVTG